MEPIIICFWCRQHVKPVDLAGGLHNHVDQREAAKAQTETKRTS
jgi:hypothetical protein